MKRIAFIPVRAGSKAIPNKNSKLFLGKPLFVWSVIALMESNSFDEIIVATDSLIIEKYLKENFDKTKVKHYPRSAETAQDHSSTESVMLEFLDQTAYDEQDVFCLVQATSPLTEASDFKQAMEKFLKSPYDSLLSVVITKRFFWTLRDDGLVVPENYDFFHRPRRQDFEGKLMENGAFYISRVGSIKKTKSRLSGRIGYYTMPEYTQVEIDEESDWIYAETLKIKYAPKVKPSIKLLLSDVDGTLTDGGMYYAESGDESKKFNTLDGKAFELARLRGIKVGIITSENTRMNSKRAEKLQLDYCLQGVHNKLSVVRDICSSEGIELAQVAYIGDDINDTDLLKHVGLAAVPNNAHRSNKEIPNIIRLHSIGGNGALREFVENYIL